MSSGANARDEDFDKHSSFLPETDQKLERLAVWILRAKVVVWFTGAGISTESGLPDYRGPDGLWTCRRKGTRPQRRGSRPERVEPNAAHFAIVELEKMGKCDFLVSQNVDNLHLQSGFPIEKLAELHGNRTRVRCRPCERTYACESLGIEPADLRYEKKQNRKQRKKTLPWLCPGCGQPVEDSVINFKDLLPRQELATSYRIAQTANLMVVVGSTCEVLPAADLPRIVKDMGGRLVIMNRGETGVDSLCDLAFRHENVAELLPRLVEKIRQRQAAGEPDDSIE